MRVADLAVFGILVAGAAVGTLFLITKRGVQQTDWSALPAEEVYRQVCSVCHGLDGMAKSGAANTYKGKRRYWDVPRLVEYMANPSGYAKTKSADRLGRMYMPPIPAHVPIAARERLAQYVLAELMD